MSLPALMPITTLEHKPVNASNIQRRKQTKKKKKTRQGFDPVLSGSFKKKYHISKLWGKKIFPVRASQQEKGNRNHMAKNYRTIISLSVCSAFRAVSGNTCGLKTSMWGGKLGKISLIPVREAGLKFFLVGSCKSAVLSWESCLQDTLLLCNWVPTILSSITPFTLFLRRHMVKETFCISAKYIKTNSKPLCIKGTNKRINIL